MTSAAVTPTAGPGVRTLAARFFGYLSADGLNYALGFVIYGWLIRVLTNQQYGQLSIATSLYQAMMMVAALGLDLTGPRLIAESGDPIRFTEHALKLRLIVVMAVCAPLQAGAAILAWHRGQSLLAVVIVASFAMVIARALDLAYLAVALRLPGPLARTRALGLLGYLVMLIVCTPLVRQHLWLVPVLNAAGLTMGRFRLAHVLRQRVPQSHAGREIRAWDILGHGMKASGGQLLLLIMQTGDVILLAKYVSTDAIGQYAMISRLYLLGTAVLAAMLNTFLPEIVSAAKSAFHLRRQFKIFVAANLFLGIAGWACFRAGAAPLAEALAHRPLPWVRAISSPFALVFLLLALANPFLSMLPSLHRSSEYILGVASAVVLLLGLDLIFMPRYGVVGAAYGQVVATAYLAAFSALVYWRHIRAMASNGEDLGDGGTIPVISEV